MLEFEGKVRELLKDKNCTSIRIERLGQNNTKVVYEYTCIIKSDNIIKGLVACDASECLFLVEEQGNDF